MRILLSLCVLIAWGLPSSSAQYIYRSRTPEQAGIAGQDGWQWRETDVNGFYLGDTFRQFLSAGSSTVTVDMGEEFPAGTYTFWAKVSGPFSAVTTIAGVSHGFAQGNIHDVWVRLGLFSVEQSWSNATIQVTVAAPTTIRLQGFWVSNNAGMAKANNLDDIWYDYTVPTSVSTEYVPGNRFFNSSFELKLGVGFNSLDSGNDLDWNHWRRDQYSTEDAHTGENSLKMGPSVIPGREHTIEQIGSWHVPLRHAPRTRTPHTFSFWAKATNNVEIRFWILPIVGATTSTSATNIFSRTNTSYADFRFNLVGDGTWRRYSRTFNLDHTPSRYYELWGFHVAQAYVFLDDFQLEEGLEPRDYAPMYPAEFRLIGENIPAVYDLDDTIQFGVLTFNTGPPFTRTIHWDEYDLFTKKLATNSVSFEVPTGSSTNWYPIVSQSQRGTVRIAARAVDMPAHWQELIVHRVPLADTNAPLNTNSWINFHGEPDLAQGLFNRQILGDINRTLSPADMFRWTNIEPQEGVFTWTTADTIINTMTNTLILASIQAEDRRWWPDWAMTNNFPREDRWSNYVYQVVNRYKDKVWAWEAPNEPHSSGLVFAANPTRWAKLMGIFVDAARAADPDAYIVGWGGAANPDQWQQDGWNLLTPEQRAKFDVFSVHNYAEVEYQGYWNRHNSRLGKIEAFYTLTNLVKLPMWNTEAGTFSFGSYQSKWPMWHDYAAYRPHRVYDNLYRGTFPDALFRAFITAIRHVGRGTKYFHYSSRLTYAPSDMTSQDSISELDDTLKPYGAVLAWMRHFLDHGTPHGILTNSNAGVWTECYSWEQGNTGNAMLVVFNRDPTNKVFTFSTDAFGVVDALGNEIQTNSATLQLGRRPVYILSSELSVEQLSEAFLSATVSIIPDTEAPYASFGIVPHGQMGDGPYEARWTSCDDIWASDYQYPDGLTTRWRVDGKQWTEWSSAVDGRVDSLGPGIYQWELEVKDLAGNVRHVTGPYFTVGTLGKRMRVNGTVNAANIILAE